MSILYIINPAAGKGKAINVEPKINKILNKYQVKYKIIKTLSPGDGVKMAKWGVKKGFDRIIACGGDGTLFEVANGAVGSDTPVGLIPCGSGNDFIRTVSAQKSIEDHIIDTIYGKVKRIDIGKCNDFYFVNVGSIGFDSEVVMSINQVKKYFSGSFAYFAGMIKTLISYKGINLYLDIDGIYKINNKTLLTAVANGRFYGGGMQPAPEAKLDDGYLDICHVKNISKLKFIFLFPLFIKGKHDRLSVVTFYKAKNIKMKSDKNMVINLDGEIIISKTAEFSIIKSGLNFIFPQEQGDKVATIENIHTVSKIADAISNQQYANYHE